MIKNKDEQIRKLKDQKVDLIIWVIALGFMVLFILVMDGFVFNYGDLEQQLESCQENVSNLHSFHHKANTWLNDFPENMTQIKCGIYVGSEEQMKRYFKIEHCGVIE